MALHIPLLANPVGWAVLGAAGYLTYKAGKKCNQAPDQESFSDRTIKGAMKTAYKAKLKIDDSFSNSKEKYSEMWSQAQEDLDGN